MPGGYRGRSGTGSTCGSRCRRCRRPQLVGPGRAGGSRDRSRRGSPPRVSWGCAAAGSPTPGSTGGAFGRPAGSRSAMRRWSPRSRPPRGCRRAVSGGSCGSPGPSPTWTAVDGRPRAPRGGRPLSRRRAGHMQAGWRADRMIAERDASGGPRLGPWARSGHVRADAPRARQRRAGRRAGQKPGRHGD